MKYPEMTPGKGSDRPSVLVLNPRNREASARRRSELLAAFEQLPPGTRADLLETVETMVWRHNAGVDLERDDARDIIKRVYAINGWERQT